MARVGRFFFLVGFVSLMIFFATDQSQNPQYGLFLFGAGSFSLGIFMMWRFRQPGEKSERFRLVNKIAQGQKDAKQRKEQKALDKAQQKQQAGQQKRSWLPFSRKK